MGNKKISKGKIAAIVVGVILVVILAVYLGVSLHYKKHFFPGTSIDGIDIGGMTVSEAVNKVSTVADEYSLKITDRDGMTFTISGSDFALLFNDENYIKEILSEQNCFAWISGLTSLGDYSYDFTTCCEEEDLEAAIYALDIFSDTYQRENVNASVVYSEETSLFEIVAEEDGTVIYEDETAEAIKTAISTLEMSMSLGDEYYVPTEYTQESTEVTTALELANGYLGTTITYDLGDYYDEVLDNDTISSWVSIDETYNVSLDEDLIAKYVQYLASSYNTYADKRSFTTALGDTITIGGGDYGWVINKTAELEQIKEDLETGGDIEREPVYSQTALYRGTDDIGNTYIEIDYTNQHLYYFEDGNLVLETDIVSGNINKGNGSPDGVFKIVYKQKDATLVGEDYESEVKYFMPFAYNVGIHDASWRSEFGGEIYKKSGSHGCINVPSDMAKKIYEAVETGTPVIAYYRDSVKLTSENAYISNAYSYVAEDD
ncbi:MAG: L,D-transpeptidase/peptidoglycan binding protein [Eubacterium sp.]|nr:L,D-transpeptidase/peptidoglycan binding protein [Eubacterium sp.]